jgi:hypothetical protein
MDGKVTHVVNIQKQSAILLRAASRDGNCACLACWGCADG